MTDLEKALSRLLFVMVIGLFVFGGAIAIGKVHEETSFGLPDVIKTISLLAAGILGILSQSKK